MNKIERIAKILELAEIPFSWLLEKENSGKQSLILEDESATISLHGTDEINIFINADTTFQRFTETDIGDAMRIITTARYMQKAEGKIERTKSDSWID